MIIERTNSEIIFRLPANIDVDALQDITDYDYTISSEDLDILVKRVD